MLTEEQMRYHPCHSLETCDGLMRLLFRLITRDNCEIVKRLQGNNVYHVKVRQHHGMPIEGRIRSIDLDEAIINMWRQSTRRFHKQHTQHFVYNPIIVLVRKRADAVHIECLASDNVTILSYENKRFTVTFGTPLTQVTGVPASYIPKPVFQNWKRQR